MLLSNNSCASSGCWLILLQQTLIFLSHHLRTQQFHLPDFWQHTGTVKITVKVTVKVSMTVTFKVKVTITVTVTVTVRENVF